MHNTLLIALYLKTDYTTLHFILRFLCIVCHWISSAAPNLIWVMRGPFGHLSVLQHCSDSQCNCWSTPSWCLEGFLRSVQDPLPYRSSWCKEARGEGRIAPKELWRWNLYQSWLNIIWFLSVIAKSVPGFDVLVYVMGLGSEREGTREDCNCFGSYMSTSFR